MTDEILKRHAKILRDSPLLGVVFGELEQLFVDRWRSGETLSDRETAHAAITTCTELREILNDRLNEYAGDGADSGDSSPADVG